MSPPPRNFPLVRPAYFVVRADPPQRRPPHDRTEGYWGRLDLEVRCVTEVHVGSGAPELATVGGSPALVHGMTRLPVGAGTSPVIPGSSVKGAVRVVVEAITPSCLRVGGHNTCRSAAELCPACELFGAPGWRAKVAFSDLTAQGPVELVPTELAQRYSHRHAPSRGRRLYRLAPETPLPAAREHLLCLPPDTRLGGRLYVEGATAAEMGLILIALGVRPEGLPLLRLGAGKNRGIARVEVRVTGGSVEGKTTSVAARSRAGFTPRQVEEWQRRGFEAYPDARSRVADIAAQYRGEDPA